MCDVFEGVLCMWVGVAGCCQLGGGRGSGPTWKWNHSITIIALLLQHTTIAVTSRLIVSPAITALQEEKGSTRIST